METIEEKVCPDSQVPAMGMRTEDTGQTMAVQHSARVTEMEDEVGGEVAESW